MRRRTKTFKLFGLPVMPLIFGYLAGMLTGNKVKEKVPFLEKFTL